MKARRELAFSFVRPDDLEAGRGHSEPLLFDRKPGHTEADILPGTLIGAFDFGPRILSSQSPAARGLI